MRSRDESGFSLIELLTAMTITLVVLSATLLTYNTFLTNDARARKLDESQDKVRLAVDRVARQLRNLATPTDAGSSIDLASSYDFMFLTSDPVKRRVRYCLEPSAGGTNEKLWFQAASGVGDPTPAMTSACPGSGWDQRSLISDRVVNRIGAADRPVFSFGCSKRTPAGQSCTSSSSLYPRVLSARVDVYVDVNAADKPPAATRLSSAVYLRNQNEPPVASWVQPPSILSSRTLLFNGSASDDPEGRTLLYQWFKGTDEPLPPAACKRELTPAERTLMEATLMGEGVTLTYKFPTDDGSSQPVRLRVTDAGCLTSETASYTVSIP
ncbi:MAG: prepilin-type N-terminal cleavage/methylation domain-containing protein [Actinomycetota bacterium]|nr:prepilin-type N-terminal cleavage/methylation domain-containing protein [Actinomycetota bacterium]